MTTSTGPSRPTGPAPNRMENPFGQAADNSSEPADADTPGDLRQGGNFEFSQGHYAEAIALYTAAIERARADNHPDEVILNLCNRSASQAQQTDYEAARRDARQAWDLSQHTNAKAAFRFAKTLALLHEFSQAKEVLQTALKALEKEDQKEDQQQTTSTSSDQPSPPSSAAATAVTITRAQQRHELQELWKYVLQNAFAEEKKSKEAPQQPETSIKTVHRPVSIKEFDKGKVLGYGNFSQVCIVTHKKTGERLALKSIEKKQAADLTKRQHPNVYNEIHQERRVLLERLEPHPNVITMYHAFQDYNTLYYLMDLHVKWGDLWSELKWSDHDQPETSSCMVGCHRAQAVVWMYELVAAVEHLHRHGIVHRDLKPENVLLTAGGHVVVIDFGTSKDLLQTDYNGPEFVGTPDFMSPEAVSGPSGMQEAAEARERGEIGAVHTADLYALGAILFILQTGHTPYWSPSPYLSFLRIKRGLLLRPTGIADDAAWDLISRLMVLEPTQRLGADAFELEVDPESGIRQMKQLRADGYDVLRQHAYFDSVRQGDSRIARQEITPVPTLRDLCIRAAAIQVSRDAMDVDICDAHPPGDGSKHDVLRLSNRDRACVQHILDRQQLLRDPRVYARFFRPEDSVACRLNKVRAVTRDFVGLTQMNDDQGKAPKALMNDPYSEPVAVDPIEFVHVTNPLFVKELNEACSKKDDPAAVATRKSYIKLLKKCIASINRSRPKLVVATGYIDESCRKLLARISESIPVVVHDGSAFFSFWLMGVQCMAVQASQVATAKDSEQLSWISEQTEICRMSKHPLFCFSDSDPRDLPMWLLKKLARGRSLCMLGISKDEPFSSKIGYRAGDMAADDVSIRSADSEEDEEDSFAMKMYGTHTNGLRTIHVDEEPDKWSCHFEAIDFPPAADVK